MSERRVNLKVDLAGIELRTPLLLTEGPLSGSVASIRRAAEHRLGAIITKGQRPEPAVSPNPYIAQTRERSLINADWSDMGYAAWLQAIRTLKADLPVPLIASVAKNYVSPQVAADQAAALSEAGVDGVTLCDYNVTALIEAVRLARPRVKCPLFAKLIPFIPNLEEVLNDLVAAGVDGIAAMDAVGPVMEVDIETGLSTMGSPDGEGYLSGRAIRPITVRYIYEICRHVDVPVIAVGGVTDYASAIEMMMVGATAVGMCTAPLLRGLKVFDKVADGMEQWLADHSIADVNEIRGLTHRRQAQRMITSDKRAVVDLQLCTRCNRCVQSCFKAAPEMTDDGLVIHIERCVGCGLCVSICPAHALRLA